MDNHPTVVDTAMCRHWTCGCRGGGGEGVKVVLSEWEVAGRAAHNVFKTSKNTKKKNSLYRKKK